jgi:hypothetical protein
MNKQKTHFMQKAISGLVYVKYDTVESLNLSINNTLGKVDKELFIKHIVRSQKRS